MKIRKVKIEKNKILGDIELDFTNRNGNVINNILIAGENGTGKTYLLDLLYKFTNFSVESDKREEKRTIEIELENSEIIRLKENSNNSLSFQEELTDNIFKIDFDYSITNNWNQVKVRLNTVNGEKTILGNVFYNEPTVLKSIFSDAEINYIPEQIKNVTAKDIDSANSNSVKSSKNLATEITQLLIDIQSLDSQDFAKWGKENLGKPVDESKLDNRIKRFTNAFNYMFPLKRFDKIINNNSYKSIIFKEKDNEMPIESLSSGEKQIVFRGSFLLKDKQSNQGALILIDEPEISLHPTWQIKILDYYKTLFTENSIQTSQLIVATHSPFIIHNNTRRDDKVIIFKKDENGKVLIPNIQKFQSWSEEQIVREAFSINFISTLDKRVVLLEGETDEIYYKKTFDIFNNNINDIDFSWVGRTTENGNVEFTGDSALNQTKNFLLANSGLLRNDVILLFDSDTKKPEEDLGRLKVKIMPSNNSNQLYKIGVENLLILPEDFVKENFYKKSIKTDKYGAESQISELDKTKLCDWICNKLPIESQKKVLQNINDVIKALI
jgi:predicted ATPase